MGLSSVVEGCDQLGLDCGYAGSLALRYDRTGGLSARSRPRVRAFLYLSISIYLSRSRGRRPARCKVFMKRCSATLLAWAVIHP